MRKERGDERGETERVHKEEKNGILGWTQKCDVPLIFPDVSCVSLFSMVFRFPFSLLVDSNSLRNSDIPQKDAYCGLRRDLFPAPNCTSTEELNDVVCFGLSHVPWRNVFKHGMCHGKRDRFSNLSVVNL